MLGNAVSCQGHVTRAAASRPARSLHPAKLCLLAVLRCPAIQDLLASDEEKQDVPFSCTLSGPLQPTCRGLPSPLRILPKSVWTSASGRCSARMEGPGGRGIPPCGSGANALEQRAVDDLRGGAGVPSPGSLQRGRVCRQAASPLAEHWGAVPAPRERTPSSLMTWPENKSHPPLCDNHRLLWLLRRQQRADQGGLGLLCPRDWGQRVKRLPWISQLDAAATEREAQAYNRSAPKTQETSHTTTQPSS